MWENKQEIGRDNYCNMLHVHIKDKIKWCSEKYAHILMGHIAWQMMHLILTLVANCNDHIHDRFYKIKVTTICWLVCFSFWSTLLNFELWNYKNWHSLMLYAWHIFFLQGIGDSSQGFANFMLFCLFTEKFQTHLHDSSRSVVVKCQRLCCATSVKTASVRFRDDVEVMCSGQETCLIESGQKTYETC